MTTMQPICLSFDNGPEPMVTPLVLEGTTRLRPRSFSLRPTIA